MTTSAGKSLRLTAAQVAEMLGLSRSRVYALAAQGVLPCRRVGRARWFLRTDLEHWLEAQPLPAERVAG